MTRLYRVADDSMGGRPTGSEGHLKVTQYIADEMRRLGLQPAGENGGYFQDLPMTSRGFAAGSRVLVGARSFTLGTDFAPMVARGGQPRLTEAATVVVGGVHGDSSTWIGADEARGNIVVLRPNRICCSWTSASWPWGPARASPARPRSWCRPGSSSRHRHGRSSANLRS